MQYALTYSHYIDNIKHWSYVKFYFKDLELSKLFCYIQYLLKC